MEAKTKALLSEMARGAQLTFKNAKELYREAELLMRNGSMSRALCLHQISLEECGKIEIIGGWATNLLLGNHLNVKKMTKSFRSHKAKNYANAYFESPQSDELEAQKRGELKAAVEAFDRFKEKFHNESDSAKNASLYVDFKNNRFSAPSEEITQEMVIGIAAVNYDFLVLTAWKVSLLTSMPEDDGTLETRNKLFTERLEELKEQNPEDVIAAIDALMQEYLRRNMGNAAN